MTIFLSVLCCSPCILILPLMLLAHSLPTPLIGYNPNNLFCHSPFHSISEVQSCQNKLCPALMLKLTQSSSSFLPPPAENTPGTAALSLITQDNHSSGEGSFPQSALPQSQFPFSQAVSSFSFPSHQAKSFLLTTGSGNEKAAEESQDII